MPEAIPPRRLDAALAWAQQLRLPRLEAQMLLLHTLGRGPHDRAWLLAHDGEPLASAAWTSFEHLCRRRLSGEPVAYLIGHKAFYGLDLCVNEQVLDPRPDTETLVDWALEVLQAQTAPLIVDLGTGSGAIALALKAQRPDASVTAIDASPQALEVARHNARRLNLPITVRQGNWLAGDHGRFDLIAGNPPYIAEDDPHLAALRHEPRMALASGADGLNAIRAIIAQAPVHLRPGGWLLLEHGHEQASAVCQLLQAAGFTQVQSRSDLAGHARCSGGCWMESPAL
ncbi:peptide chain release factor N(5)-glutamine methyltransferase [Comamonas badia]|uniref:peptide chain release factor N(5)-glutamine methyltransferase n=1 Tax=Comamonas badia TaxID=265291 RepID=UPI000429135F|nr:peptide chain release factor N(5)-glutamine methyltransferase [Comamonas badia]